MVTEEWQCLRAAPQIETEDASMILKCSGEEHTLNISTQLLQHQTKILLHCKSQEIRRYLEQYWELPKHLSRYLNCNRIMNWQCYYSPPGNRPLWLGLVCMASLMRDHSDTTQRQLGLGFTSSACWSPDHGLGGLAYRSYTVSSVWPYRFWMSAWLSGSRPCMKDHTHAFVSLLSALLRYCDTGFL